jgi:hypothetical protein
MGEAKRRKQARAARTIVYHHTSTLRTNLIWMSGVIEREGCGETPVHPDFPGYIYGGTAATFLRRPLKDFPPVAWFTTQIAIPNCLRNTVIAFRNADGSVNKEAEAEWEKIKPKLGDQNDFSDAIALHRVALGFPIANIPVVPWPEYYGYRTSEGRDLNESAIDYGDNPDDWYVSEQPVDVLKSCEVWLSRTKYNPKLERNDRYLADVHGMVTLCREIPGAVIAPSWIG